MYMLFAKRNVNSTWPWLLDSPLCPPCSCTGMSSNCVCLPPFCLLASRFEARSLLLMLLVARLFCGQEQSQTSTTGTDSRTTDGRVKPKQAFNQTLRVEGTQARPTGGNMRLLKHL